MTDSGQHTETVARKIKYLRKQRGWSQTQLAKKIKIGRPRYASYEEARAITPYRVIVNICEAYKITLDEFENLKIPATSVSRISR